MNLRKFLEENWTLLLKYESCFSNCDEEKEPKCEVSVKQGLVRVTETSKVETKQVGSRAGGQVILVASTQNIKRR